MTMTRTETAAQTQDVRLERVYPHPPERVWRALTDPQALSKWLLPTDFRPRLGHRFFFRDGRRGRVRGEVVAMEHARRLSYSWERPGTDEPPSVVTWTLEPVNGGQATRVRLTHAGPQACAGGFWVGRLGRLPRVLSPGVLMLRARAYIDAHTQTRSRS